MPTPRQPRTIRRLLASTALVGLLVLAGCSSDEDTVGEQPELGARVTEPEQGIAEAGEAQLAPGAGVEDAAVDGGGEELADDPAAGGQVDPAGGAENPTLVDGDFAAIPLPTGAQPFDEAEVRDDVTVQTFFVTASSPAEVMEHFTAELPELGWVEGEEDAAGNEDDGTPEQIQQAWIKDGQTLLISAAALEADDSQFSLQLSGA